MTAAQVFYNMHTFIQSLHFTNEDNMAAVDRARQLSLVLGTCFFTGWLLFPIGFSLGPNFGDAISERSEMVFFFFGDILAKNMYVGLMVIFKHYFVPLAEGGGVDAEMARRRDGRHRRQPPDGEAATLADDHAGDDRHSSRDAARLPPHLRYPLLPRRGTRVCPQNAAD